MPVVEIAPQEAHQRRDEFQPVDVRSEHEFDGPLGHVQGALLVPPSDLSARARDLPTDRPLLLVCRSGARSGKACEQLTELGIGSVVNLAGGMIAWNQARLPVEHTAPSSLEDLLERVLAWLVQVTPMTYAPARELLDRRLVPYGLGLEPPTRSAIDRTLDFLEEALGQLGLPDLDLSLSAFRRTLEALEDGQ